LFASLFRRGASLVRKLFSSDPRPYRKPQRHRLTLEQLEDRLTPSSMYWDGGGDNLTWDNAQNWSGDILPGAQDSADLSSAQTVQLNGSVSVASLMVMSASVTIAGSLEVASYAYVYGPFTVSGSLTLGSGAQLSLSGGGAISGDVVLGSGSELQVASGWSPLQMLDGASVTGPGKVHLMSWSTPVLDVSGHVTVDNLLLESGGTIRGTGTLEISQEMTWKGGKMIGTGTTLIGADAVLTMPDNYGSLGLEEGRTLRNEGTVQWAGESQIYTYNGTAKYENAAGAVWNIGANGTLSAQQTAGVVFENAGLLTKTGTAGMMQTATRFQGVALESTGVVDVSVGVLQLDGGGELGNSVVLAQGGTRLELPAGTMSLLPGLVVSGQGVLVFGTNEGGSQTTHVTGSVTATNVQLRSGILDGAGTLTVSNQMTWSGGSMGGAGTTAIANGATMNVAYASDITQEARTLSNDGTVNWTGSNANAVYY
jgi:hypothetical protein